MELYRSAVFSWIFVERTLLNRGDQHERGERAQQQELQDSGDARCAHRVGGEAHRARARDDLGAGGEIAA